MLAQSDGLRLLPEHEGVAGDRYNDLGNRSRIGIDPLGLLVVLPCVCNRTPPEN